MEKRHCRQDIIDNILKGRNDDHILSRQNMIEATKRLLESSDDINEQLSNDSVFQKI